MEKEYQVKEGVYRYGDSFSLQLLELISKYSAIFGKEIHLKGLVERFIDLLIEEFNVNSVGVLDYSANRKVATWINDDFNYSYKPSIFISKRKPLENYFQSIDLRNDLLKIGVNSFTLDRNYQFLIASASPETVKVLLWEQKKLSQLSDLKFNKWELIKLEALNFLAKEFQNLSRWCQRLGQTQSLLYRDDLTGLYNCRYLHLVLESEIRRAQRFQSEFCLLFVDLDNFKQINDQHGHLMGNSVLKQIAKVLKEEVREVDSVFRYGGDEYVVLLLEANSSFGTMAAERIRSQMEKRAFDLSNNKKVNVTVSIGVAACPEHSVSKIGLLELADKSMYTSKQRGKNSVVIFDQGECVDSTTRIFDQKR